MGRKFPVVALLVASLAFAQAEPAGSGGSGTVTNVTGTSPIAVATGTSTPVVSYDGTKLAVTVASGSEGITLLQGARLSLMGASGTRYLSDNGTQLLLTGPVLTTGALTIAGALAGVTTGAFSDTITSTALTGTNALTVATGARIGTASQYLIYNAAGVQMPASIVFYADNIRSVGANMTRLYSSVANGGSAVAVALDTSVTQTTVGSKLVSIRNNTTEVACFMKDGKLCFATGAAAVAGTATLVSGTVTVSTTAIEAGDKVFLTRNTPGGTLGIGLTAPVASISAATSFVINSVDAAGSVLTTDTSTVNWWIIK